MTEEMIEVIDLGKKISLLISNKFNKIETAIKLAQKSQMLENEKSGLDKSEISRFKTRGDNRININKFKGLCSIYPQISEELWHQPFETFAQEIGLSSFQKPALAMLPTNQPQIPLMGIDFKSRIKDREFLERRFEIMKGHWEGFRYSISKRDIQYVIYSVLEVNKLNENGYIECILHTSQFNYKGFCFFIAGTTYFILEEYNLLNEITFIVTNSVERALNPVLNGILLCLTGGAYELVAIPSAAKTLLRHTGSLDKIKEKYKLSNTISTLDMIKKIQENINLDTIQLNDILPFIDNHVPQDAVPYTLRAKLF